MKNIVLYTICDDVFIDACMVMLYSFITNNEWFNGDIIVIYDDLSYKNCMRLKILYNNLILKKVNTALFSVLLEQTEGITHKNLLKCYYKYEIFWMPQYEITIWADSDMVFKDSIESLVSSGAYDFCWCEDKNNIGEGVYFNTGFFVFKNIEEVKNNIFFNDIMNFTYNLKHQIFTNKNTFNGLYADQDVLNEKIGQYFKKIKVISLWEYNCPQQCKEWDILENAKIIHYCGDGKPFSKNINEKYKSHYFWYKNYYLLNR